MYWLIVKRALDVIVASFAIIVLFFPMLLIVAWIKVDSHGPVLFKQLRSGKDKKPFIVYKLRTMSTDAPSDSPTSIFKNSHSYITNSGKILRKLSIDELPQLINVLKGDMSIVGPRPVVLKEKNLLMLRQVYGANSVKPGITGWAQVNGRDELNDSVKAQMDGEYIDHFGPMMDFKCLRRTIWAVLSIKGHQEGHEQQKHLGEIALSIAESEA